MFNDMLIVSTAVSSFNNAALYSPLFFVVGLFSVPVFFMIYVYGRDFIAKIGWDIENLNDQIMLWMSISLLLWLMLFGGNYAVLRDGISLLPVLVSAVLFCLMIVIVQKCIKLRYLRKIRKSRWIILLALIFMAGFSAMPNWWGILLQVSAILCGMIVGCRVKQDFSLIPSGVFLLGGLVALVLMQPEYFRFGQLGNLTIIHLLSVIFAGWCAVTALVTRFVNQRGRIHQSAYVKLKWLGRIVSLLAFILFLSTESVPVFIGLILALGIMEMLSVYHAKNLSENLPMQSFAMLMISVGIIMICPVISAMGVVLLAQSGNVKRRDFRALL